MACTGFRVKACYDACGARSNCSKNRNTGQKNPNAPRGMKRARAAASVPGTGKVKKA